MITRWVKIIFSSLHVQGVIVALVCVCLVFPEVVFMKASLRTADQLDSTLQDNPRITLYPKASHREWWHAYNDNGGSAWQSEPMMEFMVRAIQERQSPFWNPYSAAGSLGPETLVDNKFSVFTAAYAFLGGGANIYNALLLFLYFLAVYFVYLLVREKLNVSVIAGVTCAIFYLLNGYNIANIGSNVTQSYLYIPACLYFFLSLVEKPTAVRIVGGVFSGAALMSCTFLPTTITSLIAIYGISIGYAIQRFGGVKGQVVNIIKIFVLLTISVMSSILLLAFLYFPIAENIGSTGLLEMYSKRVFYPIHWIGLLSLFSASHFYELYNAQSIFEFDLGGNTIYHLGVVSMGLIFCSFAVNKQEKKFLVICCLATISLGFIRLLNVPILGHLIEFLPVIGSLGSQYIWPIVIVPSILLIAIGVDNLQNHKISYIVTIGLWVCVGLLVLIMRKVYGFNEPNISFKMNSVYTLLGITFATGIGFIVIYLFPSPRINNVILFGLVLMMFLQLIKERKLLLPIRSNYFSSISSKAKYIRKHIGFYRTLTIGDFVYGGMRPELGSAFGISDITSMNEGVLPEYIDFFHKTFVLDPSQRLFSEIFPTLATMQDTPDKNKIDWTAINFLGVKYVFVPASYTHYQQEFLDHGYKPIITNYRSVIYENPSVFPRSFAFIKSEPKLIDNNIDIDVDIAANLNPVKITQYENVDISLEGEVFSPSLIVLTDNWHSNWIATLNGSPVPILKVNGIFRGVFVGTGAFLIKMHYEPKSLNAGIFITILMVFTIIVLLSKRQEVDSWLSRKY